MDGYLRVARALGMAGSLCLPLFALLLRLQPKFVHGLRVDARSAERNCLLGGACYAVVVVVASLALWCRVRRCDGPPDDHRNSYDQQYKIPFSEHASDEFAVAMKAMDARRDATMADKPLVELTIVKKQLQNGTRPPEAV